MSRWLALCSKSAAKKFLFRHPVPLQSSNGVLGREFSQFKRTLIHSPTPYGHSYLGKLAEFAPYEMIMLKRCIHATGVSRSPERDYYETLGVSKSSTRDEIKKAFHALAKKYHPDANKNNPSAKRKFQEIRDAYETLRDPEKRTQYDKMRQSSKRTQNAQNAQNAGSSNTEWDTKFSWSFEEVFSEIFEDASEKLGGDIQVEVVLSFSEATKGCTKNLSFNADVPCDSCDGRGYPLDAKIKRCPTCQGVGRVTIPPFTTTCGTCKGSGRIIKGYCMECQGSGVCKGVKDVKVTIPAGVDSGDTIHVPNAGNSGGQGGTSGNLFIKLKVAEDHIFSREGADIYVNSNITFTQAILGGNIDVPTLSGKMQLRIPKGVQHGQLVLLRGKGLPKSGFFVDHGDQYVRFCINLPSTVSERQRAILEEFEKEIMDANNTSAADGWWQYWLKRATQQPKFVVELSILTLVLLFLIKALN